MIGIISLTFASNKAFREIYQLIILRYETEKIPTNFSVYEHFRNDIYSAMGDNRMHNNNNSLA